MASPSRCASTAAPRPRLRRVSAAGAHRPELPLRVTPVAARSESRVQLEGAGEARHQGGHRCVRRRRAAPRTAAFLTRPLTPAVTQTVKDVLQTLVDDGIVDFDKIGSQNFFWAFPSKALLKARLRARQAAVAAA